MFLHIISFENVFKKLFYERLYSNKYIYYKKYYYNILKSLWKI